MPGQCHDPSRLRKACIEIETVFFVFGRRQMMRILYFEDPLVFVLSSKLFFVVQI